MLASVLARIREIGLRRAVGATERDIVVQFLIEALTISLGGGLLGIGLGLGISAVIEALTGIPTLVSGTSIAVSFVVSAGVGLVFGLLPARRAAERDPVEALRYE
jgi:putative ABC transport system permease protein